LDYDGERIRPGYLSARRYRYIRHVFVVRGFDPRTPHIILYDQSNWSSRPTTFLAAATGNGIATASMCMDRPPSWLVVLFNSRLGRSIHVEFFGM